MKPFRSAFCFLLTSLIALFILTPCALAGQKEDTARLHTLFEDILTHQKDAAVLRGGDLEIKGEIEIVPVENYYAVTLPDLTFYTLPGGALHMGRIALNVLPGDTAGSWKITMALPSPMLFYAKKEGTPTEIRIGAQNFSGLWNDKINYFSRLNARYQDISLSKPQTFTTKIEQINVLSDLKQDKNEYWSGPVNLTAKNLHSTSPLDGSDASIGLISVDMNIQDYSPDAFSAYQEKIGALAESYKDDNASISPQHLRGLYNLIFDFMGKASDGLAAKMTLQDLRFSQPAQQQGKTKSVHMDKAGFGYTLSGFRADNVALGLSLFFNGLAITPQPEDLETVIPETVNVTLKLDNLPYSKLVALGDENLKAAQISPEAAQNAKAQALLLLPKYLTEAQSHARIEPLRVENGYYSALLNAAFVADLNAAKSATGTAKLQLRGLDTMMGYLKEKQDTDSAAPEAAKDKINQTLAVLTILQIMGQQGQNDQGRPVRSYDFELKPDGADILNGADLQTLFSTIKKK